MEYVNLNRDFKKNGRDVNINFFIVQIYFVFFLLFKAHIILLWSLLISVKPIVNK